ncbi:hypothetical protein GH714_040162 [Hevea brasiliensis]|uniref:ResB-like domain-containing protein n=1 Tax=Hevea brasiliensis TaxID=3981 RepID=A0A6A6KPP6_HEVBR|nr:hypothetical protein GH714_040162 [Hevea brasiliensis]
MVESIWVMASGDGSWCGLVLRSITPMALRYRRFSWLLVRNLRKAAGGGGGGGPLVFVKRFPRRVLSVLSNLPLAIGEMFAIAGLMALGTVIDQGEAPDFYFQKYPEENPVLGFFTWRWILALGFDHMFSSPVFLGMLALLGTSLMAALTQHRSPWLRLQEGGIFCTQLRQSVSRNFQTICPGSIQDLGVILMGAGYEVFLKGPSLYAFKGLASRFAPIGVHLAMLLIMAGGTLSAAGASEAQSMLARDLQSIVLYDQEGKFVGVRRPNSKLPIDIDGTRIVIEDAIGSTGLQLKTDPGVPVVYAGFGALMLTTCISYLSHSQIWALQDGTAVVVGGKTNRAKAVFEDEVNRLLDHVPEVVESSSLSKQSDMISGFELQKEDNSSSFYESFRSLNVRS